MVRSLGQGTKIPRATGQLSLHTTTTELPCLNERAHVPQATEPMRSGTRVPQLPEPTRPGARAPQLEKRKLHATTREKPARRNERSRMPQWNSCVPQLRPDTAKNK